MRRAEESAGLRSQLDAAKATARDAELRETVQVMTSALMQQGRLLAAMATANPGVVQELQQQQRGALGVAPVVVGSNEDGTPVLDLGAITGLGAQLQGGGAAQPPTENVMAARAAVEEAEQQFHESRFRLSKAWEGEETSESEGEQGGGDEEELPELEDDDNDSQEEMEDEAVHGGDEADEAARAALDDYHDTGAGECARLRSGVLCNGLGATGGDGGGGMDGPSRILQPLCVQWGTSPFQTSELGAGRRGAARGDARLARRPRDGDGVGRDHGLLLLPSHATAARAAVCL